jgi:hypothetical protein
MLDYAAELVDAVAVLADVRGALVLESFADRLLGNLAGLPGLRHAQLALVADALEKAAALREAADKIE